jgi:hypothetical protein
VELTRYARTLKKERDIYVLAKKDIRDNHFGDAQILMNVHLDLFINAELGLNVSTVSQDMHVNAPQDTKETVDMVVIKARLKLDVAQILIVLTMLNVTKDLVRVDQDLKQLEQFVLTLMSVNGRRIFVALVLLALIK